MTEVNQAVRRTLLLVVSAVGLAGLGLAGWLVLDDLRTDTDPVHGLGVFLGIVLGVAALMVAAPGVAALLAGHRHPPGAKVLGVASGVVVTISSLLVGLSLPGAWVVTAAGLVLVVAAMKTPVLER
ncbi:MAG TPA: hypothetical protein VLA97_08465 [Nocardioidaceae bacterium]|jgi:hypothetical protein|nr:hypothetical protein [Nocardioidaceae bacterium]